MRTFWISCGCVTSMLSLLACAVAGCATTEEAEPLSREITVAAGQNLVRYEKPRSTSLRVAPLYDARPVKEREVAPPPFVRSVFLDSDSLDDKTFDGLWSGAAVADQMTNCLTREFERTGYFEKVSREPEFPRETGEGFIVSGQIESFEGRRRRNPSRWLTGGDDADEGTSDGRCRIRFAITDGMTGQHIYQDVVDSRPKKRPGTPADAALVALSEAQCHMANEVTKFLLER